MRVKLIGEPFDVTALDGPVGAEQSPTGAAPALRALIANPNGIAPLPTTSWRLLYEKGTAAEFAVANGEDWTAVLFHHDNGQWSFQSAFYQVTPRAFRSGCNSADWHFAKAPQSNADAVVIDVVERACTGGAGCDDRLLAPEVLYGDDRIVVTCWVRPLPPAVYPCPGNPPARVTVPLDEQIKSRPFYDGSFYPPRPI